MEFWQLSDSQVKVLVSIRDRESSSLHIGLVIEKTRDSLLKRSLIKRQPKNQAYLVLTERGKDIIRRVK